MNAAARSPRPLALGEQIADRLRREIITGQIPDGTHLAEDHLAERFDVSRGPVRDALRELESEGLVENRRKRLYARSLGMRDLEELYLLRETLESLALRLALDHAAAADWDRVDDCVQRMGQAAAVADLELFLRADMEFHTSFYELSGNRRLSEAWRPYQRTFSVLFEVSGTADLAAAAVDHQGFLETIRSGDAEAAVRRLHTHLVLAKGRLRDALRPSPTAAAEA